MQITRLIYASNHGGLSENAADEILEVSRRNNLRDQITGALIIRSEDFVQLLEGPRTVVADCFERIVRDVRHRGIQVMYANDAETRLFPSWSMHVVSNTALRNHIIAGQLREGTFHPDGMTSAAFEGAFRVISSKTSQFYGMLGSPDRRAVQERHQAP